MERSLRRENSFGRSFRIPVYVATGALAVLAIVFLLNSSGYFNEQPDRIFSRLPGGTPIEQSQQVMFPMDRMPVGGTALDSQNFSSRSSAFADSSRSELRDRIQTVEF